MILIRWRWLAALVLCAGVILLISRTWADPSSRCSTYPRGPVPPVPLGTYVNEWHSAQAAAADADHFVIYRHEWYQNGKTLGPYGHYHLQQITKRLTTGPVPFPVVIQLDLHDRDLNLARKAEIVNALLAAGVADAPTRVILGFPEAEGLYGEAAPRIFLQQIQPPRAGFGSLGGAGGTTGFGTGGMFLGGGSGSFGGGFRGY
jgi:hypothetical protein